MAKKKKKLEFSPIVLVLLVILLLGAIYLLIQKNEVVDSKYQAIFLENNQIYFGLITSKSRNWIVLENVYYLQQREAGENSPSTEAGQDLQLVKLGNEIHGPEDSMTINKSKILFIENLKPDSEVVTAIEEYVNN